VCLGRVLGCAIKGNGSVCDVFEVVSKVPPGVDDGVWLAFVFDFGERVPPSIVNKRDVVDRLRVRALNKVRSYFDGSGHCKPKDCDEKDQGDFFVDVELAFSECAKFFIEQACCGSKGDGEGRAKE